MQDRACLACGAQTLEPHLRVAGEAGEQGLVPTTEEFGTALSDIVRCRNCGHMQLERMPSDADLSEGYAEAESEDYVAEEQGQRVTADAILDRIEAHVEPGRLVDLGCWVGYLMDEARRRGWRAVGVEPSEFASRYAREKLGLEVITAELLDAELSEGEAAAVFMGDVIEHLPDPGTALDRIGGLLKPDGVLALALPDSGSRIARRLGKRWWSVIPTHVHYFTRRSLATLLDRKGYEVLEISTAPKSFSVGYYLGRISGYSEMLGNAAVKTAGAIGLAERLWAPDFRDRMLVIARPRN